MARLLKALFGSLLILLSLLTLYGFAGTSNAETLAVYRIDARDPGGSWVDVTLTLKPAPRLFIDLSLRDRYQAKNRVRDFTATRRGHSLAAWQALPGVPDLQRVWTGFSTETINITYRVHPQWRQGENNLRSYLGPEYGYLRAAVMLYTPISVQDLLDPGSGNNTSDAGRAMVSFDLPENWQVISPLDFENVAVPVSVLRSVYFGVGALQREQIQLGEDTLIFGIWQGFSAGEIKTMRSAIPVLYESMLRVTGFSPKADTCFRALTVLPTDPIHGGAAGTGSLVVENNLATLAREMFHWWNGETLHTASDANWLQEGFTNYYQARVLYQTGLWSQVEYQAALRGFRDQLWSSGQPQPVNLVEASKRLTQDDDPDAYRTVYYGGALLAYQLDQALQAQGSSLDALWPALAAAEQTVDTSSFLSALETVGGSELRATFQSILNGQAALSFSDQP